MPGSGTLLVSPGERSCTEIRRNSERKDKSFLSAKYLRLLSPRYLVCSVYFLTDIEVGGHSPAESARIKGIGNSRTQGAASLCAAVRTRISVSLHLATHAARRSQPGLLPARQLIGVVPELIIATHVAASSRRSVLEVVDLANNRGAARHLPSRIPHRGCGRTKGVSACRRGTRAPTHTRTVGTASRESCTRIHRPSSAHASLRASWRRSCGRSGLFTPRMRHLSRGASQKRGGLASETSLTAVGGVVFWGAGPDVDCAIGQTPPRRSASAAAAASASPSSLPPPPPLLPVSVDYRFFRAASATGTRRCTSLL